MEKLRLTIACERYDRVQALTDGRVPIEGCAPLFLNPSAEETFHRAFKHREFDVCELSLSSYMISHSRGNCPYVAIPVFVSRTFRHSAIYVRSDRGIASPADLKGRTVGVPEYQMTAALWVRGLLADRYGVAANEIAWRTGGLEDPGREEKLALELPPSFDVRPLPADRTLSGALADGTLDALVTARTPSTFDPNGETIVRLFRDFKADEQAYYAETKLFPIMHLVAVRKDLAERFAWLPRQLLTAFSAAKDLAAHRLAEVGTLGVMLPWLPAHVAETLTLMGEDYWPYGVSGNRHVLEHAVRYAFEQGLTSRRLSVDELFANGTQDAFKL